MVADVPVGVFLSGGYDSSCVTAYCRRIALKKFKTFTIGSTDKIWMKLCLPGELHNI